MLTKLTIRNFKRFDDVEIELDNPVVFIGPNNSGKTSAMQALALWDIGLKRWNEKRAGNKTPTRRPGVTINRKDLLAIPHPSARLLWRDLRIRDISKVDGHQRTDNVRIDVIVEGATNKSAWTCGLEFDYANEESFYCRPLRTGDPTKPGRMPIPDDSASIRVLFLPPMSGLVSTEPRLDLGAVNVRIGEGRTAEVLRNLCYTLFTQKPDDWEYFVRLVHDLFGATINPPRYIMERGEITMDYSERGTTLDLSSSGRGLQQTLLVLAYLFANQHSVILLDEPGAHLEILRQRNIYHIITEEASKRNNQIIAATHSPVLLNEAAGKDLVIAFVDRPHKAAFPTDT